jgi:membrane protein implicated in regulation of membrane protease activity
MVILVLVLAAAGSLAASLVTRQVWPAWLALALCLLGLALTVGKAVHKRRLARKHQVDDDVDQPVDEAGDLVETAAGETADGVDDRDEPASEVDLEREPVVVAAEESVSEMDELVRVVKGRRRFHTPGCRVLATHPFDELTRDEAVEEGFTPCTVCEDSVAGRKLNGNVVPV